MTISSVAAAKRKRRLPEDVRSLAVASARRLLLEQGPGAITLKAVAAELGMAHGNLTHHFGSVASLQSALAGSMARELTAAVEGAVGRLRAGDADAREVVDLVFEAFESGGAARLVAWLVSNGQTAQLTPLYAAISDLIAALSEGEAGASAGGRPGIAPMVAAVLVPALGAALLGSDLSRALGLAPDAHRQLAAEQLTRLRAHD